MEENYFFGFLSVIPPSGAAEPQPRIDLSARAV